jgi:transglutaminase-like putative cysteine protease
LETAEYAAGTPILTPTLAAQRVLHQKVRVVGDTGGLLHVAGDLIVVDQDYSVAWRSPEDIFVATITTSTYEAKSAVSTATEAQLRAAGDDYPQWVRDRYLALPSRVPARVLALARSLTATEPTPYDRARAIEAYLRSFPYSLDVPLPPTGRDVVDYFLFDLREGYCDYYATAMVVLARAAGLPARMAVGYATGYYDPVRAEYVVTEASAHAWPEIYFPGYGWIEFEPTAGFPSIERIAETTDQEEIRPMGVPRPAATWQSRLNRLGRWALWGVLLLVGAAVMAWPLADLWRLHRLEPRAAVAALYRRLQRRGRCLAVPVQVADTPYEFAVRFADRVAALAQEGYSGQLLAPAAQEANWLTDLYVQISYSTREPGVSDRAQAIRTWLRLRWRLWLGRVLQRLGL